MSTASQTPAVPYIVTGQAGFSKPQGPFVVCALYVSPDFATPLKKHIQKLDRQNIDLTKKNNGIANFISPKQIEKIEAIVPVETIAMSEESYNNLLKETECPIKLLTWVHCKVIKILISCYPQTQLIYVGTGAPLEEIKISLSKAFNELKVMDADSGPEEAIRAARIIAGKRWKQRTD